MLRWWPPTTLAKELGIPPYAENQKYNVYILTFWLSDGAADTALVWENALGYFSIENPWGAKTTKDL